MNVLSIDFILGLEIGMVQVESSQHQFTSCVDSPPFILQHQTLEVLSQLHLVQQVLLDSLHSEVSDSPPDLQGIETTSLTDLPVLVLDR